MANDPNGTNRLPLCVYLRESRYMVTVWNAWFDWCKQFFFVWTLLSLLCRKRKSSYFHHHFVNGIPSSAMPSCVYTTHRTMNWLVKKSYILITQIVDEDRFIYCVASFYSTDAVVVAIVFVVAVCAYLEKVARNMNRYYECSLWWTFVCHHHRSRFIIFMLQHFIIWTVNWFFLLRRLIVVALYFSFSRPSCSAVGWWKANNVLYALCYEWGNFKANNGNVKTRQRVQYTVQFCIFGFVLVNNSRNHFLFTSVSCSVLFSLGCLLLETLYHTLYECVCVCVLCSATFEYIANLNYN